MKRLHALITGRVQGVSFRYHTLHTAQGLGLTGWVRNLPDGRVEVMAEGEDERVRRLEQWLHRGPTAARVTDVYSRWQDIDQPEYHDFALRW